VSPKPDLAFVEITTQAVEIRLINRAVFLAGYFIIIPKAEP